MGFFDFVKDAGDTRGVDDAEIDDLRKSNTVVRKLQGAKLPVENIDVEYDDGTVTLRGSVPRDDIRQTMVILAGNTPGVARVVDELEVDGPSPKADLSGRLYTVRKGDTLSGIAEERLGDAGRWKEIFEANRAQIDDPDEIYPGQTLRMPA